MNSSNVDVTSLRVVPVLDSCPQLTEDSDLVGIVSIDDVPIVVYKDPDALWVLGLGLCDLAPGTIDVVPRVKGDDCIGERTNHMEDVHLCALEHTDTSSKPLDTSSKCVTQPVVLHKPHPDITAASIMRDIDRELELQDSDHVEVLRALDRSEMFLRQREPSKVSSATSLSFVSLNQMLVWIAVVSMSTHKAV